MLCGLLAAAVLLLAWSGGLSELRAAIKYSGVLRLIQREFVGEYDPDAVTDAALAGAVDSLDDSWSYYMDAETYEAYQDYSANRYQGIGVTITKDEETGGFLVLAVTRDGPALTAGIVTGDIILAVDGTDVTEEDTAYLRSLIQADFGETAVVTVLREDGTMEDGVAAHPINDSFVKYFGSNSDTELQYFESADEFKYLPALGVFVSKEDYEKNGATVTLPNGSTMKITKDDGAGTTTVTVTDSEGNEITFTANTSDIENVNNSTFGTNMTMGELMGDVSSVVSAAAQVVNNPSMIASMIGEENLARYGITPDAEGNYDADQLFNAVVLAVAEGTSSMGTAEQIIAAVESGEFLSLSGGLNDPQLLPKAALAYGMLTGFANSDVGQTATITIGEGDEAQTMTVKEYFEQQNAALSGASGGGAAIGIVFNMLNTMTGSEGWNTYYTTQGPTDLTGYLSAMNAIADNTGAIADSGALTSGFDDPNLVAILNGMFGGGN